MVVVSLIQNTKRTYLTQLTHYIDIEVRGCCTSYPTVLIQTMPNYCSECGKKATQKRVIDQRTSICNECAPRFSEAPVNTEGEGSAAAALPHVDDSETLNNVTFGALKAWLTVNNNALVSQLEQKLTVDIVTIKHELEQTKTKVEKLEKDVKDCKKAGDEVRNLETRTKLLEDDLKKQKTVGENNLKYLINLDRNDRRQNVVVFGVPEDGTHLCMVPDEEAKTDEEKCKAILQFIETPVLKDITAIIRLGQPVNGKVRPIKLKCRSSAISSQVLTASKKLKELQGHTIYIKPDKTKAEVAEYQRLGKRKTELEALYPIPEGGERRVVLEKGVIRVDGVQVDEFKSTQSLF